MQRRAPRRLDQQLCARLRGEAHQRHRHRVVEHDGFTVLELQSGPAAGRQKLQHLGQRGGRSRQQGVVREWRHPCGTPLGQLLVCELSVVAQRQSSVQRVVRKAGLHQDPRRLARAAGAPGNLHQQREQPLRGSEIGCDQLGVRIQHAHDRYALEVMSLGNHLRSDQ